MIEMLQDMQDDIPDLPELEQLGREHVSKGLDTLMKFRNFSCDALKLLASQQDACIIPGHNGNLAMMRIMDDYYFMHFRNPLDSKQARKVFLDDRDHVK